MDDHDVVIDIANFTYYIEATTFVPAKKSTSSWSGLAMKNPPHGTIPVVKWANYADHDHLHTRILRSNRYRSCYRLLAGFEHHCHITARARSRNHRSAYHLHRRTITPDCLGGPFEGISMAPGGENDRKHRGNSTPALGDVTVYSSNNCLDHDTVIGSYQWRYSQINGPLNLCNGQSGVLQVLNANEFVDFQWTTGDNTPSSNSYRTRHRHVVTVTDANGCMTEGYGEVFSGLIDFTASTFPAISSLTTQW